jgi:hypothetical protein
MRILFTNIMMNLVCWFVCVCVYNMSYEHITIGGLIRTKFHQIK